MNSSLPTVRNDSKKANPLLLLIICFLIVGIQTAGSCDQTTLSGTVQTAQATAVIGEPFPLTLQVSENQSQIHKVFWEIEPSDAGTILFGSELMDELTIEQREEYFSTETILIDRHALFLPHNPGTVTLSVQGYFRQTNPQPITSMKIEVSDG